MSNVKEVQKDLNALHPMVQRRVSNILTECQDRGIRVRLFEALRTKERQEMLVATKKSKTLRSYHRLGLAADIVFLDAKGNFTWDAPRSQWDLLASIMEKHGMFSLWKNHGWDGPHCELHVPGMNSAQLYAQFEKCKDQKEWYAFLDQKLEETISNAKAEPAKEIPAVATTPPKPLDNPPAPTVNTPQTPKKPPSFADKVASIFKGFKR